MRRERGVRAASAAGILAALVFALFPIYWLVLIAFRPRGEIFKTPPSLLPDAVTLDNVRTVWFGSAANDPVLPSLWTSFVIAVCATALALVIGSMCAYAIVRHRVGGRILPMWILSQRFLPAVALVIPFFIIFSKTGLFDSHLGLVLLYATLNTPMAVWLLTGFIESLPPEVEEAAMIDGASRFQTFRRIVLPLLKPGLAVTAIFVFLFCWNEYILAYQLAGDEVMTITVYLPRLRSAVAELYGEIAAASLLSVLPALLFAWVMQRYLVRGITLGAGRES